MKKRYGRLTVIFAIMAVAAVLTACSKNGDGGVTPTPVAADITPTPTSAPTATPAPTPTPTPEPTPTPVPTARDTFEDTGFSGGYFTTVGPVDWEYGYVLLAGGRIVMLPSFTEEDTGTVTAVSFDPADCSTVTADIPWSRYPEVIQIDKDTFAVVRTLYPEYDYEAYDYEDYDYEYDGDEDYSDPWGDSDAAAATIYFAVYDGELNTVHEFTFDHGVQYQFNDDGHTIWYMDEESDGLIKYDYILGEEVDRLQYEDFTLDALLFNYDHPEGYLRMSTWNDRQETWENIYFDAETKEEALRIDGSGGFGVASSPDKTRTIVTEGDYYSGSAGLYRRSLEKLLSDDGDYGDPDVKIKIEDPEEVYAYSVDWENGVFITRLLNFRSLMSYATFSAYDLETGELISKFDISGDGHGPFGDQVLDAENGLMYIVGGFDGDSGEAKLYAWDYLADDADDTVAVFGKGSRIPDHIDELRVDFEKRHNFQLYLGTEIYANDFGYEMSLCTNWDMVEETIGILDEVLAIYPDGFFDQMKKGSERSLAIYLCDGFKRKDEYGTENAIALASSFVYERSLALDVNYQYCLKRTIVHEISHWIDGRIEAAGMVGLYSDYNEQWLELQPSDFYYKYSYNGGKTFWKYIYSSENIENAYFTDDYSQTYPGEDRARLFEYLMYPDEDGYIYMDAPYMREKLHFYFEVIREVFDDRTWPEETAWEKKLREYDEEFAPEPADEEGEGGDAA